jgi:hypothetical protein
MKTFSRTLISLLFVAASGAIALAQKPAGPPVPYIDKGACPFECCTYREWGVVKPTVIRKGMNDTSPVVARLKAGDKVRGMSGVVITTAPGIVQALKRTTVGYMRVNRGDRVYVLTNLGEGFAKVWFKGRIVQGEPYDESIFKPIRQAKSVWWVKIKDRRGRIGWSRLPENFDNVDQCG